MPIIYAGSLYNRGGTGVYTRRLLEGLADAEARVAALAGGLVMSPKEALERGISESSGIRTAREYLKNPALLRKLQPSLVHLPSFSGRVPGNIPCVVTLHDLAFARKPAWFPFFKSIYYRLHFSRVARKADAVMVDSDFTGSEARELLGIPPGRIRRVYLSTSSFDSDPAPFIRRWSLEGKYLLFAGTVEPRKNIEALLDAWERIRNRAGGMTLVIAGRWGWGSEELLRRLRSTEGVLYTGALSDPLLRSCISGAELMVYPSFYEGFGLPPLEAASAGVPSVISPAEALTEIYGDAATVARGFDGESLEEAILDALETHLSPWELMDFAADFSIGRMTSQVLKVYGEYSK